MMIIILRILFNLIYLSDLIINTILLGDPSETVSSRLGRAKKSGRSALFASILLKIVDKVFYITQGEQGHSESSIEPDEDFELEIWSWIKKGD